MSTNNNGSKILLVDDEQDILEFVSYTLKKEGFTVYTALNGKDARGIAKKEKPDLIILDIMMPEMDGIETCRELRDIPFLKNTVISFLTARNEDYSQIAGFEVGADDYITKPIRPRVLTSRIKALLRRKPNQSLEKDAIALDGIQIDREKYIVTKEGERIDLRKKEFELLALLVEKPGKVFTRDEILNTVWGNDIIVGDRTIDVHINKLREKVGEKYIRTIKGVGYKFEF
ncbi:MAG TPA: response regulator transcription factor [Bacteroidia bacterium]|nr:response regulator transcription factor [Bacteroidia bacterium]